VQRRILIKNRSDSPYVLLDSNEGFGEITGKSFPPDVTEFYTPLIEWFEFFKLEIRQEFELNIKLDYINTASLKVLMDLMYKIEEVVNEGKKFVIKWYYPDDDSEMREIGEEFDRLIDVEFEYISYGKNYLKH
jgi:hypothetical protein